MKHSTSIVGKASILAVGTELTTGQITNRNAAWISEKLTHLGIEILFHEAVPDDQTLIHQALDHCAHYSQLLFITGGLGPTTDDFTRNVIADWLNKPLQWDQPTWDKISERLTRFGLPVAESNRQQAFFPKGAQILPNPEGTAAGFTISFEISAKNSLTQQMWVFPGPPSEVHAVWGQEMESQVRQRAPGFHPLKLFTWQCLGKSEAELGEITESALAGSALQTGYRAYRPYVEIKVWCPPTQLQEKQPWLSALEKAISPWVVTRDGEDLAMKLLHHLQRLQRHQPIQIFDAATGGILTHRLRHFLKMPQFIALSHSITVLTEWASPNSLQEWAFHRLTHAADKSLILVLGGFTSDGDATVGLKEGTQLLSEPIQLLFRSPEIPEIRERMQAYVVEAALKQWCKWLDTSARECH